jgi:hypothetical protein
MNSLYEKDNLLPYVSEQEPVVQPKPSIFKPKLNKNGLATAAFIAALSSIVLGFLIVPSILGITLGVGALIIAVKKALPKKMPIIAIALSAVMLVVNIVGIIFLTSFYTSDAEPYIPVSYTHDKTTGIAYKYTPVTNIPCDSTGKCVFEVKLFQVDPQMCSNGGNFTPEMKDLGTSASLPFSAHSFPAMKEGEEYSFSVTTDNGVPNGRLIVSSTLPPISCN